MKTVIGILAAGSSARMRGRDKLLEDIDGEPLLARQIRIAASCDFPVLVAVPPDADVRRQIAQEAGALAILVEASPPGMGDSIAALASGAERMGAESLLLLLADMPEIEEEDLRAILSVADAAAAGTVVRAATADGRPGHPVAFPRAAFPDLRRLSGDTGARAVIAARPSVGLVPLAGERALTDLDTPEAWAIWRASRPT